jgi:hypothetical protein
LLSPRAATGLNERSGQNAIFNLLGENDARPKSPCICLSVSGEKVRDIQRSARAKDGGEVKEPAARERDKLEIDPINVRHVTMDFVHPSTKEPAMEAFLDNGDPRMREVVKTTCEELPLPEQPPRALAMGKSARVAVKAKRKILFIDVADVIAVEARGKHVLLLRTASSHMLRDSISTMEEKLNLHGFVRIHRSVLVNAAMVEEMHPSSTGEYVLRVRGGREFTVTRTYRKNLQLLAQLWIGMEAFLAR